MFTKKPENFDHLGVDDVTHLLGGFYEAQLKIITDKDKGCLRTTFGILANRIAQGPWVNALFDAVLEKNGIKKIKTDGPVCHNYLPEIIAAVEARGSNAAEGLKKYNAFVMACEVAAAKTPGFDAMSLYQKVKTRLRVSKQLDIQ
ncbi:MAG: hypothetical protein HYU57_01260 [Micavibrio aeruginosavorus]|nr:hypothetical protein [Micavibrio aeruginosavorus]